MPQTQGSQCPRPLALLVLVSSYTGENVSNKLETSASLGIHLPLVGPAREAPQGFTVRRKMDTGCPKLLALGPLIANWDGG